MLTLRQSPFDLLESDLFQKLEQQLMSAQPQSANLQKAERSPAADVQDGPEAYTIALDLPGVDKTTIDVKATDRTLVISAERQPGTPPPQAPLISEIRYGTWSRSFRFPAGIDRDQLQATYRDGLLSVRAPKAQRVSTVSVKVEG